MNLRRIAPVGLVLAATLAGACTSAPEGPRPNVILISADTLRADHVGADGYPRETTPTIDALAARGVRFANAYSQAPNTAPSHTTILTSLYPSVHGVFQHGQVPDDKLVTLPEALHNAGYQTGAFTQLNGKTFKPGFDTWYYIESALQSGKGLGDLTMVSDWIGERTAPWFLFLHSYDVHLPYAPEGDYIKMWAEDYDGPFDPHITRHLVDSINDGSLQVTDRDLQFIIDMYDAELRRLDDIYGRFFAQLQEMGEWDNTIVVFLSDHGEEFGEHGKWGRHTYSLNEELLRVPLIIAGPGIPEGQTVDAAVRLVDVAPTILDLLGVEAPEHFMGEPLEPVWEGSERAPREVIGERATETLPGQLPPVDRVLIHAGFKYTSHGQLYDLHADRWGTQDIAADNPDLVARMNESLLEWVGRFASLASQVRTDGEIQLTAEEERRLRALGYLQ